MHKQIAIRLIRAYRYLISPLLGDCCRFYPSCSQYGEEAIATHGLLKGSYLTLKRLGKCHPFHPGGIDLVPGMRSRHTQQPPKQTLKT